MTTTFSCHTFLAHSSLRLLTTSAADAAAAAAQTSSPSSCHCPLWVDRQIEFIGHVLSYVCECMCVFIFVLAVKHTSALPERKVGKRAVLYIEMVKREHS